MTQPILARVNNGANNTQKSAVSPRCGRVHECDNKTYFANCIIIFIDYLFVKVLIIYIDKRLIEYGTTLFRNNMHKHRRLRNLEDIAGLATQL